MSTPRQRRGSFSGVLVVLLLLLHCSLQSVLAATYSVGDVISTEDQQLISGTTCYTGNGYGLGKEWTLADFNGATNGGRYNVVYLQITSALAALGRQMQSGEAGTVHQQYAHIPNAKFLSAFQPSTTPSALTCQEFGELAEGGGSQVVTPSTPSLFSIPNGLCRLFGCSALPTTIWIDHEMRVRYISQFQADATWISTKVDTLLNQCGELCESYTGCRLPSACNYDALVGEADADNAQCTFPDAINRDCDGSCLQDADGDDVCDDEEVSGCTESGACNFDTTATDDDGSCVFATDHRDCDGACLADADGDGTCDGEEVVGCTDSAASNYNPAATDDGPCEFLLLGDVDGNEVLNVLDIVSLVHCIMGGHAGTHCEVSRYDMNKDGSGNVMDAILLVYAIMTNGPGRRRLLEVGVDDILQLYKDHQANS